MSSVPLDVFRESLGKRICAVLRTDREYSGVLCGFDDHINLVLDDTAEVAGTGEERLGRLFLSGKSIAMIILEEEPSQE
ncbi:MAG: U6 snRNA-associated Sm-like protein LSm5 [Amphiamblys sp. WSBS2006]|nr:MAG: U6 snRNA-associated Sm-like protein LSm5 [Amphiamblys sp. WSBS2006]